MADCGEHDIFHSRQKYDNARELFKDKSRVDEPNKSYILDFLDDCELGKTVLRKAKKRIGANRLIKYLYTLSRIHQFLRKDFKKVTQAEMETFIRKVDSNTLSYVDGNGREVKVSYTAWTRRDIKVTVKKFYKWLLKSGKEYPPLVSWIDTYIEENDPPALSLDEIKALADYAKGPMRKAMVWALFETGARIGELLNVRLRNVADKSSYYLIRIEFSKTFKRTIPIYEGQNYLRDWLAAHPHKGDSEAVLFPTKYPAFRLWLKRLGRKAIGKNIHPHLFRHSYATWLASKKVGRYQMCKLMGWAMSSDMPDRYIDREGVVEEETLRSIRGDELSKAEAVNSELKRELAELQMKYSQIIERLEQRKEADDFLEQLVTDSEVQELLCQKIKEMGLKSQLMSL